MNMTAAMEARTNKPLTACTDQEIYLALQIGRASCRERV